MAQNNEQLERILERIRARFEIEFEPLAVDGGNLEVLAITNMRAYLDRLLGQGQVHDPLRDLPLWAKVWPASFILGRFLRNYAPEGKTLLELGAGTGVCGLIASRYGFADITLTDFEDMALDFARANILRNQLQANIRAVRLDLARQNHANLAENYDFIVASEILYLDNLHRPILKLLHKKLAPAGKAFFCTDMARLKPHFKKLAQHDFNVQEGHIGVKSADQNGEEQRRVYNILILEKRG